MELPTPRNDSQEEVEEEEEEMTIYLKVMKTSTMKVQRSDTIGTIKSAFCEKEGIPKSFQELFFNGDRLKDDQRVVEYGIPNDATLHLILQSSVGVKLLVVIPSRQRSVVVEARTYDTVQKIKAVILEKEQILPHQYNLVYAGEVLEDDRSLASLNLQSEPTLHLIFNPKDLLSFSVITPAGETVKLKVKFLYSVSEVKAIIGGVIGVPVSDYDLIYQGKKLEDSNSLACYDLQEESILEMSPQTFQVFVKAWSGKTITLNVHQRDTIEDVKDKIFQKLGGPSYCQSIVFSGKRLEANLDLAYYNIRKNATLHMVFSPSTITTKMGLSQIGAEPNSSARIRDLKAMIQNKLPSTVKEVYFREIPLQDECSIASYNIGEIDELTVVSEQRW
ncbi:PREDICTED: polyubiquitin-like [Populus euphratica]|uniref:Polyubiquitin-like n=1 Tax=Populus euphratica TaxID=75702 RepID=A0AAJ6XXX5_POPEU|nr:PREDICTED: polyubiquitin-like [Populus euphratica]